MSRAKHDRLLQVIDVEPSRSTSLRDADGGTLPLSPRKGMVFRVQWGEVWHEVRDYKIRRVTGPSFYVATWGRPVDRRARAEWRAWLFERMQEGEVRLRQLPEPPRLALCTAASPSPRPKDAGPTKT